MTIYTGKDHRRIYEQHYGPIPKEQNGRTYDIHHIDGNHYNNDPVNLVAVTKQEHYDIHYSQKDWAACQGILSHLDMTPEEISRRATEFNNWRVAEGIHPFSGPDMNRIMFQNGTHPFLRPDYSRNVQLKRVHEGTHPFLGGKLQQANSNRQIAEGTHNFVTNHPNTIIVECPHCGKQGGKPNMRRWHFDKCKSISLPGLA